MNSAAEIAGLEQRLVNAWPSFEIEMVEGWLLRFAEGYSKRANSASPLVPGARLDAALVTDIAERFALRGLAPCFRLTGVEDPGCDAVLAETGYVPFDPSYCLVAPLDRTAELDATVQIEASPRPRWVEAASGSYGGDKANGDLLGRIVRLIRREAAFATLRLDDQEAAWGLGVYERGYVGLYDIVVAPDLRGLGLGRKLVCSLMSWGAQAGAHHAYLQMRVTNEVAHALYRSLGFVEAYRYTHRVPKG